MLTVDPYCLYQMMADKSSEKKKDSTTEGGVFVICLATLSGQWGNWHFTQVTKEERKVKTEKKQPIIIIFK